MSVYNRPDDMIPFQPGIHVLLPGELDAYASSIDQLHKEFLIEDVVVLDNYLRALARGEEI